MAESNTYLEDARDRIAVMCGLVGATFDPPVTNALTYVDPNTALPCWWIYPGVANPELFSIDHSRQNFAANIRLITGLTTQGFDGALEEKLWVWLPTVINYFESHRRLVYQRDQRAPRYFEPALFQIVQSEPFGAFAGSNFVGVEFSALLPFTVENESAY